MFNLKMSPSKPAKLWILALIWIQLPPSIHPHHDEPDVRSCSFEVTHIASICEPCKREDTWLNFVKAPGSENEQIMDSEKMCFNNDPIQIHHGDPTQIGEYNTPVRIAQGPFLLSNSGDKQFRIDKSGFFRYAYVAGAPASEQDENYLDLDAIKKYYERADQTTADIQLVEWPGLDISLSGRIMHAKKTSGLADNVLKKGCKSEKAPGCEPRTDWVLDYDRHNGKIYHYPCNIEEGMNVVVVAAILKPNESGGEKKGGHSHLPNQTIWLSHGRNSMYTSYNEPLAVPERILMKMAKPKDSEIGGKNLTWCKIQTSDNEVSEAKKLELMKDLRTAHDFTFTRHRLLISMKCGILIVSGIETEELVFETASLKSNYEVAPNLFPEPLTALSATTCCSNTNECSNQNGIIAAYAYDPERKSNAYRFIYVSFDLGDTFEQRIVATPYSPVNLIKGLYKLYEGWDDYYQILHEPDQVDLEEDDEFMRKLRTKPLWDVSSTSEKERFFRVGSTPKERKLKSLERVADILENRVRERRSRLHKDDATDKTPQWAEDLIMMRKKLAGWQDDWEDETCKQIPECKKKFEFDKAVEWLLKDGDVHVVTPRRNESEPYCKDIPSILVIPEEKSIMALCEIGYGRLEDDPDPWEVDAPGGPPPFKGNPLKPKGTSTTTTTTPNPNATTTEPSVVSTTEGALRPKRQPGENPAGTGTPPPPTSAGGDGDEEYGFFALYSFAVKENIPVIYGHRVSERVFSCKYMRNPDKKFRIHPEVVRIPGSGTLFISNCEGVLYLSTNFGKTIFNSAFYYEKEKVEEFCKKDSTFTGITLEEEPCKPDHPEAVNDPPTFIRSFSLCALNVPPLIAVDSSSNVLLMTFGKFYARGAIAYNREARLVVGETLRDLDYDRRFENIIFPGLSGTREAILAVALKHAYSIPDTAFKKLYENRLSLRLVPLIEHLQFYKYVKNFYEENLSMCVAAYEKGLGFPACKTISFSVHPEVLHMDVGETEIMKVRVQDDNPYLPLWIFSSNGRSVDVITHLARNVNSNEDRKANLHGWDVEVTSTADEKTEEESLVDAFFGSSYNNLHEFSTQISLVNTPTIRCHVQPSGTVKVELGCKGKRLAAHEDLHRPQCEMFKKNFKYTLKKGLYDPDFLNYWILEEKDQKKPFFELQPNGDVIVTYDYSRWGCPIEPFGSEPFIPDLRILNETTGSNTSLGEKFKGKFIMIEILGATGFEYTKTVRDVMNKSCKVLPQNLKDLVKRWKYRQRLFQLASSRQSFPTKEELQNESFRVSDIRGNILLDNPGVRQHINIWNRANYKSCEEGEPEEYPSDLLDRDYEVLTAATKTEIFYGEDDDDDDDDDDDENKVESEEEHQEREAEEEELNKIRWLLDHPRVYLFLVVAVDEYDSFCTYQTIFGVSLKVRYDMNDLESFLVFLLFVLIWWQLIVGGYKARKRLHLVSQMRAARQERLEQAAWTIIYRYEKLIHGNLLTSFMKGKGEKGEGGNKEESKNMQHKKMAELKMKKAHLMAQEQARHEKLQKFFEKE